MKLKALVVATFALALFTLPKTASAGGGLVYLTVRPNTVAWGNNLDSRMYVVRTYIDPSVPCRNVPITFKFEDPHEGDRISVPSPEQPYVISGLVSRIYNGRTVYDCTAYAKVFSGVAGERLLYTEVGMPDGTTYKSSKVVMYFNNTPYDYGTEVIQTPWDATGRTTLDAAVISQRNLESPKREVIIGWNKIDGAIKYNVYPKLPQDWDYGAALVGTGNTYATLNINSGLDYYVKVTACYDGEHCLSSRDILIGKTTSYPQLTPRATTPTPTPTFAPPPVTPRDLDIERLNQKIENLEQELDESKAQQSLLEQKLNEILNLLKSIFPFFK